MDGWFFGDGFWEWKFEFDDVCVVVFECFDVFEWGFVVGVVGGKIGDECWVVGEGVFEWYYRFFVNLFMFGVILMLCL